MCGIAIGIGKDWNEERINFYLEKIKHRGPDNTGKYNDSDLFLGHVRLSIIDTSTSSNQPFIYKNYVMSYNGEMYNYIEEREFLKEKGYEFVTDSDTEVIIKMLEAYGLDFIHRVNGMFVISIYDTDTKNLYVWRDRFGIKPFYYYIDKDSFIGCSEIKPMLQDDKLHKFKWNKKVLASYIRDTIVNYSRETFYEGIYQLEPGYMLKLNTQDFNLEVIKYYSLDKNEIENCDYAKLKELLHNSVNIRMRSDVGFSSALSGGVDSTLITRLMQENKNHRSIEVFSMLRDSKDDFDTEFSLNYKNKFPDNSYVRVNSDKVSLTSLLNDVIYHQEEPFQGPSILLQNLMYKMMHENSIKVVLEGQGGDEVFIGYERYLFADRFFKFFFNRGMHNIVSQTGLSKKLAVFYWFYFRFPLIKKLRNLAKFGFKSYNKLNKHIDSGYTKSFAKDLKRGAVRNNEISKFQLRRLLNYGDKNSMAHSVEVRLPFLDYRVVECSMSRDESAMTKDYWSKYQLRKMLDELGLHEFAWRKNKNGFDAPDDSWNILKFYPLKSSAELFFELNVEKYNDVKLKWKVANIRALEKIFEIAI